MAKNSDGESAMPFTHRFKITVNYVLAIKQSKAMHKRIGELSDQIEAKALVAVLLD